MGIEKRKLFIWTSTVDGAGAVFLVNQCNYRGGNLATDVRYIGNISSKLLHMSVDPLTALANGQHTLKNVDYSCLARPPRSQHLPRARTIATETSSKKLTQGTTHQGWKINGRPCPP